jgi:hypothetical protein
VTELAQPRRISSPAELGDLLRLLKREVTLGAFRQLSPKTDWASEETIDKIPDDGPWPDYIDMLFEEAKSGQRYRLSVETYHGSGGTWDRV